MKNIFIGRQRETKELNELKNKNFFLVVSGRRRIGKTILLKNAFPDSNYIFFWPNKSIDWILIEISKELNVPQFRNFKDLINFLLDQKKILIIDEFQNILSIDNSIYGEIQNIIDERKFKGDYLKIAVAGSSFSLMNKVFNDAASPLYGRRTHEIKLSGLSIKDLFKWVNKSIEDFIELWSVFEGVPYYYELIDRKKNSREDIKSLLISKNARLLDEGKAILSMEFSGQSKTYDTILSGISEGKTKLNELATLFENKSNLVIKYLSIMRNEFGLIKRVTPIIDDPNKSKEGIYEINDNFLKFWFNFIERNRNYIEQDRFNEIEAKFENNFNSYVGKSFEKFIILLIKDNLIKEFSKGRFTKIGVQFGQIKRFPKKSLIAKSDDSIGLGDIKPNLAIKKELKIKDDDNSYEIDICGVNEKTKEILFGECKWKEKVNALSILNGLKEKTKNVDWNSNDRKEIYTIFAKSFSRRATEFEGKRVFCFDLKDIEKLLKG